jgi:hypothetical protein
MTFATLLGDDKALREDLNQSSAELDQVRNQLRIEREDSQRKAKLLSNLRNAKIDDTQALNALQQNVTRLEEANKRCDIITIFS